MLIEPPDLKARKERQRGQSELKYGK